MEAASEAPAAVSGTLEAVGLEPTPRASFSDDFLSEAKGIIIIFFKK